MKTHAQLRAEIVAKVANVIRLQHKALATERAYSGWIGRYYDFCITLPREWPAEQKMEVFLTDLAVVHDVSASTQNGAFHAICFLYVEVLKRPLDVAKINAMRAQRPEQVRHAPSLEDTIALLRDVKDVSSYPSNLVARLLYGCGLRVSEPLNLRIKDVKIERHELHIKAAKGKKDRVVRLPDCLVPELQQQIAAARIIHERDQRERIPVELPHQLARKYPEHQWAWPWAWLFPMHKPCQHPRTGQTVRWRMMEDIVQRAVKESRRRLGIQVVPHELRHAYATHSLDAGISIKALQQAMGHVNIQTTANYCHADALSVASPLDRLPPNVVPFATVPRQRASA
jgi:integron integrase